MERIEYERVSFEVIIFRTEDIVTASSDNNPLEERDELIVI